MTELIAEHIANAAQYAHFWGFFLIFFFMTVESSFIPFPSEVVMIPAGFLAYRGELTFGNVWIDCPIAILAGVAGSLAGAFINYYLSLYLGRTALHKYGKYFFLKEETLDRAEEVFRRLLPAIRQLISIPAGLSKMNLGRFTLFTGLGAGIWVIILTLIGVYFGHLAGDMSYVDMVRKGKDLIADNYIWILIGLVVFTLAYFWVHKRIMKRKAA